MGRGFGWQNVCKESSSSKMYVGPPGPPGSCSSKFMWAHPDPVPTNLWGPIRIQQIYVGQSCSSKFMWAHPYPANLCGPSRIQQIYVGPPGSCSSKFMWAHPDPDPANLCRSARIRNRPFHVIYNVYEYYIYLLYGTFKGSPTMPFNIFNNL